MRYDISKISYSSILFFILNNLQELIDQKTAESLLEKATIAAEESAKSKKKDSEEEDKDKDGKKEGGTSGAGGSSSSYYHGSDEEETEAEVKIHEETTFETLKDGSSALIIKPGFR